MPCVIYKEKKVDLIILLTILISGTVFGSFFTLAVHRIPRKENITYVRSYCPRCNHKLYAFDLIPVLSYIFLGGKCRYCKDKIRPRYLLLEIFSGLIFLLVALSHNIGIESSLYEFIEISFIYLFLCGVFIIGGIDKENLIIPNGLIIYELIVGLVYIAFKIFNKVSVYSNIVGLIAIPLLFTIINLLVKIIIKDENKLPFGMGDIKYIAVIGLFLGFSGQVVAMLIALLVTLLYLITKRVKEIPFGYYLSIATAITIIILPHIAEVLEIINFIIV